MVYKFKVKTSVKSEMADITREVEEVVRESGLKSGICHIFVPHTTCGLAINENADPDVKRDIIAPSPPAKLIPWTRLRTKGYGGAGRGLSTSTRTFSLWSSAFN